VARAAPFALPRNINPIGLEIRILGDRDIPKASRVALESIFVLPLAPRFLFSPDAVAPSGRTLAFLRRGNLLAALAAMEP
jgi:hypothetical protein